MLKTSIRKTATKPPAATRKNWIRVPTTNALPTNSALHPSVPEPRDLWNSENQSNVCKLLAKEKLMAVEGSTGSLIASDKESGKAVYGAENTKIGSIERVMVDETSGEIAYAVLNFGEFLGTGNEHYPVAWKVLRYDPDLGGYLYDWSVQRREMDDYYNDDTSELYRFGWGEEYGPGQNRGVS
jgi:hypothetical protein